MIEIDKIDYTDGDVHIFGGVDPDGVTETVTIVAIGAGRLAGDFWCKWGFVPFLGPKGEEAMRYTSGKGNALQCLFDAITARRYGELCVGVFI